MQIIIQCTVNYIRVYVYIYIHILLLGGNVRFFCLSLFNQFKKRIILQSISTFLLVFTLSWAAALTGCGSSSDDDRSDKTADVEFKFVLAQQRTTVPAEVKAMRFDGSTIAGNKIYSSTKSKDALNGDGYQIQTVLLKDVPVSVTQFIIYYLDSNDRAIATSHVSVALHENQKISKDINDIEMVQVDLTITPKSSTTPMGVPVYFRAEAKYADGVSHDVTKDVEWSSSDRNIAAIDETGLVTPAAVGTVEITAVLGEFSGSTSFEVTDAALESISVDSETGVFETPVGVDLNLSALGTFSDGTSKDITAAAVWESSDKTVATVSKGVLKALKSGETTVTVGMEGSDVTASVNVTVNGATVESLTIGSKTGEFSTPIGVALNLTVQANMSDGTSVDITTKDAVTWSSDSTTTLTVEKAVVTPVTLGKANVTAEFEGVSASQEIEVADAVLQSLAIEGETSTPLSLPLTLKAMGVYSDGSSIDVTSDVAWSAEGDATVDKGVVTPTAVGTAVVSVASADGSLSAETTVTITDAVVESLTIGSKTDLFETPIGVDLQLTVQANYSDGTSKDVTTLDSVTWSSAATSIASVSLGNVSANKIGSAEITAEFEGKTASQSVEVTAAVLQSIAIEGETSTPLALDLTLKAMGTYSDGTTQELTEGLTWSAEGDATVADGVVTPTAVGSAKITVASGEISGETTVTITDAVVQTLTVGSDSGEFSSPIGVPLALTLQANMSDGTSVDITNKDGVKWSSDATSILTVANAEVKGVKVGTANVTAEFEGVSASQEIEITDAVLQSIAIEGETSTPFALDLTLTAMGTYSDGTTKELTEGLTWTAEGDATVADGVVTPTAVGSAKITVASGEISGETTVTITDAVVQTLTVGSASGEFSSPIGVPLALTLQANMSDGTSVDITTKDAVKWSSDATSILTVASAEVKGVKVGTANVTAEFEGVSASQEIEITDAVLQSIAIEGETTTPLALELTLKAMGTFSDGTTQELTEGLTWSAEGGATVAEGVVTPTAVGEAVITVAKDDITGETTVTITDAVVQSLTIGSESGEFSVDAGLSLNLTLTAELSDGSTKNFTNKDAVTWTSDATSIATVSIGVVKGIKDGQATITAEVDGVSASQSITVGEPVLESLAIEGETSVELGETLTLKAVGTYSDGSTSDVTDTVTWSASGAAEVAGGVVTPTEVGTAVITAEAEDVTAAEVTITVTEAALVSLQLESDTGSFEVAAGNYLQLKLTATYADGSTVDVTKKDSVTWSSDSKLILTVNHGVVNAQDEGTAIVTAVFDGETVSQEITVTPYNG